MHIYSYRTGQVILISDTRAPYLEELVWIIYLGIDGTFDQVLFKNSFFIRGSCRLRMHAHEFGVYLDSCRRRQAEGCRCWSHFLFTTKS